MGEDFPVCEASSSSVCGCSDRFKGIGLFPRDAMHFNESDVEKSLAEYSMPGSC